MFTMCARREHIQVSKNSIIVRSVRKVEKRAWENRENFPWEKMSNIFLKIKMKKG